jgi:hypothetical protein
MPHSHNKPVESPDLIIVEPQVPQVFVVPSTHGEVTGCPTGLSDLTPSPPSAPPEDQPVVHPPLEVERLPERDEEIQLGEDEL